MPAKLPTRPTTCLLVDGSWLAVEALHGHFHAQTSLGRDTTLAYRVLNRLLPVLNKHRPSKALVVYDGSGWRTKNNHAADAAATNVSWQWRQCGLPSWLPGRTDERWSLPMLARQALLPEYKRNRRPNVLSWGADTKDEGEDAAENAAAPLLMDVVELLRALTLSVVFAPGEADDVIAAAAMSLAQQEHHQVLIFSADHDYYQLLAPKISVLGKDGAVTTREQFVAEYGFLPELYADYLALKGDKSDEIKSLTTGIGEKCAQKLIMAYGGIDAILASEDDKKNAKLGMVKQHAAALRQRKQLFSFAPLKDALHKLRLPPLDLGKPDEARLVKIMDLLELNKPRKAINSFFGTQLPLPPKKKTTSVSPPA